MKGYLLLEDGTVLSGDSFGYEGAGGGEIVFNTAMTGYQEILTDPSYYGQIVVMTYPLIGNYGVNPEDVESRKIFLSGLVVTRYVDYHSNFRATESLAHYLKSQKIAALEGIDTRAVTRKIRSGGTLRALIGTEAVGLDELKKRMERVPSMKGLDLASAVACGEKYEWFKNSQGREIRNFSRHIVVIDCGVKQSILRRLVDNGAKVTVIPPTTPASEIRKLRPDGVVVSNGPGDPDAVPGLPEALRDLIGTVPLFGICLGHQLLALAIGAKTYKLKFGHHGANHPVRNMETGRVEITSQNHGFAVDSDSLGGSADGRFGNIQVTHMHLSDGTIEGFRIPEANVRAIQYHPEAGPGPHDAAYLFEEFLKCTKPHSIG